MSGVENSSGAGAAQSTGTSDSGKPTEKLRDVSSDEANRFSGSLAKKGDGKGTKGDGTGKHSGEGSGLPRPQTRAGAASDKSGEATAKFGGKTSQTTDASKGNGASQKSDQGERGVPDQAAALTSNPQQAAGGSATAAAAATASAQEDSVSDLASKLANRILASKPESGSSEVRIELNMNKLQGAVITLRQDANGLNVVFDSPSPEVTGRLMETRGDLVQRLQAATGENVTVDINEQDGDQDQQPGDGRSRNQYDEELEGEESEDA